MTSVGYNEVLNAFIDALPFNKIPNNYKSDTSLTPLTGRDGVCSAVRTMMLEWQTLWSRNGNNIEKMKVIQEVEDSRDLLIRREEQKELVDEVRIAQLLSDMIPEFKDGTYVRLIAQREVFLVTQMAQFLERAGVPIPEALTHYITQHEHDHN